MNQFENHRTDDAYESALILKLMVFRFINNYTALFYIAFVKPFITSYDPCTADDCMKELQISLGTIFFTKIIFTFCLNVIVPIFNQDPHKKVTVDPEAPPSESPDVPIDPPEVTPPPPPTPTRVIKEPPSDEEILMFARVFKKPNYDSIEGTFEDYSNHAIVFGFTTMFISAFPIAIALALLNNYREMRLLGWKMSFVYRRPLPRKVSNIGLWFNVFEGMSAVAVAVNAGLIAFTQSITADYSSYGKVWLFGGIIAFVFYLLCYMAARMLSS